MTWKVGMQTGNVEGMDCGNATSAFWDVLPVTRCRPGRDQVTEKLSFRLFVGDTGQAQGTRAIRIYIFSEVDWHELYTLDISEDDFLTLKAEQGILVDFSKFSHKVIDLVQKCIDADGKECPKFKAVLDSRNGDFVFKLVETNDFKQIPHISLAFRQGNSLAIQCFLAFRTTELKVERDLLQQSLMQQGLELSETKQALSGWQQKLEAMEKKIADSTIEFNRLVQELQDRAHCELVKQREDAGFAHCRCVSVCPQAYAQHGA